MRKCMTYVMLAALAFALPMSGALAQGPPSDDPVLALDRTISGLDENGFFIPGTTQLEVTVTISVAQAGTNNITALGVQEFIPAGWSFGGLTTPGNPPIAPQANAQNTLDFGYIQTPALPTTFGYFLNVPGDPAAPVSISGSVLYRTSSVCPVEDPNCGAGQEIQSDPAEAEDEDTVQQEPTIVSIARSISGDGVTGDNDEFYVAGETITVTLDFTKTGDANVTALGFVDEVSPGVTFVGFEPGAANPTIPPPSNTGTLDFGWITPPQFPFTVVYNLELDADLFGTIQLLGLGEYRLDGGAIFTDPFDVTLTGLPCMEFERSVTGGFTPGEEVDITVTIINNCNFGITALGLNEQIPAGWSYVGVSGPAQPGVTPTVGAEGSLDFAYIGVPTFPAVFTYTLAVPAEEEAEEADITGQLEYRLNQPGNTGAQFSAIVTTTVSGVDETPPVITLLGDNPLTLECSEDYVEPGFEAIDDRDGDVTANVEVTGTVDSGTPGTYELTYSVSDAAGNEAVEVRVVEVVDTLAPVITLNGQDTLTVECGSAFTDPGATAEDACDGDITANIVVDNTVNPGVPGNYTISYDVSDAAGNAAATVVRNVTVVDTTPPVISLSGGTATVECGATYTDAGATATDACDGAVSVSIDASAVDTSTPGSYEVLFSAEDSSGNVASASRTVNVVDTTAPVITLSGAPTVTVECTDDYVDAGATAQDACDGAVDVTVDNPVDTSVPGAYTVTYTATDAAGNTGEATRTVNVVDTTAPVITVTGGAVTLECGDTYSDAGATAADDCDGDLTGSIEVDNPVDTSTAGTYTVTYTVSDAAGNEASATRTVTVEDTTAPVITLSGSVTVTVECGDTYTDAGATAEDACDGDISGSIVVDNTVDTSVAGTYTVTYNVSDGAGNAAAEVSRTVIVEDTTAPVITLNGSASVTLECGEEYVEAGATAADACDGEVDVVIDGTVDTSNAGTYTVTYNAVDAAGNAADEVTRTVIVEDTTAPVITLEGQDPVTIDCGEVYEDAGASATDACDGEVAVTVDASAVNNAEPGTYIVVYTATDSAGNTSEETRTVNVEGPACEAEGEGEGEGVEGEGEEPVECVDTAGNGYPDNPSACLGAGESYSAVVQSVSCDRATQLVTWFDGGTGTVSASVINPDNPSQVVTVSVPRDLIGPGEQGVLILAVSCDVVSLLSPEDATDLTEQFPDGALNGAPSIEVSLIVSGDGGSTFSEITDLTASSTASTLTITGLDFTPGLVPSLLSHPTLVDSDEDGIIITGTVGEWAGLSVTNLQRFGSTLIADLLSLSTFNVFEVNPVGPTLSVSPNPRFDFIVGIVELGSSVDNVLTLRNVGSGTVNGAASISGSSAFTLVGATNYSLTGDQTRNITVRFTPTAVGNFTATLNFTNSGGAPVQVTLRGTGTEFDKPVVFFGCGASQGAAGGMGFADLAVLLLALGALVGSTRLVRSRQHG